MKILILSGAVLLILAAAIGGEMWWSSRPQIITLEDGNKVELVAVSYGKRHPFPHSKLLPGEPRPWDFPTATKTLVVWMRVKCSGPYSPDYSFYLYDKSGTACVKNSLQSYMRSGASNYIIGMEFDAFPRRQSKFILRAQGLVQNEGEVLNEKYFTITNPLQNQSYPKWTAETLPDTESDEDFSATLTQLTYGADANFNRDQDHPDDAINLGVEAVFHVQQNGTNAINWQATGLETTDATENHQSAGCNSHWDGDNQIIDYQWGLWPGEPWKLRVEFSKQSNYDDDELLTVKGVPFVPGGDINSYFNWMNNRNSRTNAPFADAMVNGVHVKIYPVRQFSGQSQPSAALMIHADSMPEGMQITVLKITDAQGDDIDHWGWTTDTYGLRDTDGLTNLTVTIAVHKSHFFEFTVIPQKETDQEAAN